MGMSLGNTIARVDRRMKGQPTPSKEGTPPETTGKGSNDISMEGDKDINDAASMKDAKTVFVNEDKNGKHNESVKCRRSTTPPKHLMSPKVQKVLDFNSENSDDDDDI